MKEVTSRKQTVMIELCVAFLLRSFFMLSRPQVLLVRLINDLLKTGAGALRKILRTTKRRTQAMRSGA